MQNGKPLTQQMVNQFVGAAHGDLNTVKTLLEQYPELVNTVSDQQETAIQAAAHTGQTKIVEFLLERGAPLDICTAALLGRHVDMAAMLVSDPSLANATGAHGIPLMFYTAMGCSIDAAALALRSGAAINAGEGLNTPLHGAVLANEPKVVAWLLDHGADPNLKDYNGKTPLEVSIQYKRTRAEEALRKRLLTIQTKVD